MELQSWKEKLNSLVIALNKEKSNEKPYTYFSISTTSKITENKMPFLTPKRQLEDGVMGGTVVFSQHQTEEACSLVDGKVDYILIDVEKKLPISFDLSQEEIDRNRDKGKSVDQFEMGNLSSIAKQTVKKSKLIGYKPNDLTVEAAWHFSNALTDDFSGKKISIIGCGNIGFKLAMKYVEAGANVIINRRDLTRGMLMANVINLNKPPTTIAHAYFEPEKLKACLFSDFLIAASSGGPIVNIEMLKVLRPGATILDIGKGSLQPEALEYAFAHNLKVYRCDVSSALYGYLSTLRNTKLLIEKQMGRRELVPGVFVVSGGAIGRKGDLVVDSFKSPQMIYGIADGEGDLVRDSSFGGFKDSMMKLNSAGIQLSSTFKENK